MKQIVTLFVVLQTGFALANVIPPQACGGKVFVEDVFVIDSPYQENCAWEIQTQDDRILVFTMIHGTFEEAQPFMNIHDGVEEDSEILLAKNQKVLELSRKDSPTTIYTSGSTAMLRFKQTATTKFQLKIQKAVNCPFNLGSESQCGRVVDEVSCYCALFTKRKQRDQKSYCTNHGMSLLTLEDVQEEQVMHSTWFTDAYFWTSLTDGKKEGDWIWESTNANLYPGYSNWCTKQPDNSGLLIEGEDCMIINYESSGCWNDLDCEKEEDAICEAHP